jgi:hypothetical protein
MAYSSTPFAYNLYPRLFYENETMQKTKYSEKINIRDSASYDILKKTVTETFGRKIITSRECRELADDISKKTSFIINFNTLRRFFGLINSKYPPSVTTTDILAKYCGFNSLHTLVAAKTRASDEDEEYDKRLLEYIIKLFKEIQVIDAPDATFVSFVALTIKYLDKHPEVANAFQKAVVKTKNGRAVYFEQFLNLDHLHLYLQETKEPAGKIFAHSLLCLRYWLVANDTQFLEQYNQIEQLEAADKTPVICGLYCAAQLLYADITGTQPDAVFADAAKCHLEFKNTPAKLHESFEFIFCRALILTGHFEQATFYSTYLVKKYPKESHPKDFDFFETLQLFKGIALSKTNEIAKAKHIFSTIQSREFNFLTARLDTILHLVFASYLGRENSKLVTQTEDLIASIGFVRLNKISQF